MYSVRDYDTARPGGVVKKMASTSKANRAAHRRHVHPGGDLWAHVRLAVRRQKLVGGAELVRAVGPRAAKLTVYSASVTGSVFVC